MYVIVHHQIKNPENAFQRGQRLISGDGAPASVKVLQFYPAQDLSFVTCLWESDAVASVQGWGDSVLGDASENRCYAVDAERPLGLAAAPMLTA